MAEFCPNCAAKYGTSIEPSQDDICEGCKRIYNYKTKLSPGAIILIYAFIFPLPYMIFSTVFLSPGIALIFTLLLLFIILFTN